MEWWQSGLFALLGVIAGGLFTYLGLRYQLNHQEKFDTRSWRRNVRSEPLLEFRKELANIATRLHILVKKTQFSGDESGATEEERQKVLDDWRSYIISGEFLPTLYIQSDSELKQRFEQIENTYMLLFEYALEYKDLKAEEKRSFRDISQKVSALITEAQELINQRLEAL